ncbi:MAG: hypothetical protein PVI01_01505 [Gemmatimonadales bacterium]|jgi:hypothetical protein
MRRLSLIAALALFAAACSSEPTATDTQLALQQATTITADSMTAEGLLTEVFPWTLEKTASPAELALFRGDMGTTEFTVTATRGEAFDVYSVAGKACATNTGADPTEGLTVTVKVQYSVSGSAFEDLSDASVTITPETQLAPTEEACYDYEIPFDPVTDAIYRSVAEFAITNLDGTAPGPLNADFEAPTDYTGQLNASVNVEDSSGQSWTFDDTGTQTYEQTFACDDNLGDNANTATIVETGDEASATVTVTCYALDVAKTAESEFTRTWQWALDKTSDVSALTVPVGFPFGVDYSVTPTATSVDGDAKVSGTITVTNPAPIDAKVLSVADAATPDITLAVTCEGASLPVTLAMDETLECTYEGDLPDLSTRDNVATAELQNVTYDAGGVATETGTTAFTGTETIDFGDPTYNVDTCIDVTDDQGGSLGTACLGDLPKTFTYTVTWGPFTTCGGYVGVNVASFVTNDTGATGSDSWTVAVNAPCGPNCTLGQGYWKNHSEHGPAKYDETWAYLPDGADTRFFDSGLSWLETMRTAPKGGNAYFILARQYAAAWLNGLRGADVSAVAAEIQRAAELLDQYDGNPDGMDLIAGDVRKEFIQIAETLDYFNNGRLGPGKCD